MSGNTRSIRMQAHVVLTANIRALTGLRIGGASGGLAIGALDNPVVRDALTGQPYIPGSSLKGKLRSLTERLFGLPLTQQISRRHPIVEIHVCKPKGEGNPDYAECPVCPVFGVPGDHYPSAPTRLLVRDTFLDERSAELLSNLTTDTPYAEIKWEAAIDRITSAATPRQVERVPAGTVFGPCELVYTVYEPRDIERFWTVVRALDLLEDDYLGSYGSRGSGKVRFENLTLTVRPRPRDDRPLAQLPQKTFESVDALLAAREEILSWLRQSAGISQQSG